MKRIKDDLQKTGRERFMDNSGRLLNELINLVEEDPVAMVLIFRMIIWRN